MKNFIFFWFLLSYVIGQAQENKQIIWGTVTDGQAPIEAVNITVSGTEIGTTTDNNGKYEIKAKSSDVLEFSYVGKKTVKIIVEDVTRILNIEMWPKFEELDEVVVTKSKRKTQRDLSIDYEVNKSIVFTSLGYLSPESTAYSFGVIDGGELNNAAIDILSALQGKFPGMRIGTNGLGERALYGRSRGSISGGTPFIYEIDGALFLQAPTWLDINNVKRVGILGGLHATWRFGSIAAGGVVFINTKTSSFGAKEEGTNLPYDRAKLRNNIFENDALDAASILQANPMFLRELHGSKTVSAAEEVFEKNKEKYQNSPYFFIDSYAYFMEKNHHKFAKNIADEAIKKAERNPSLLKVWAYYFDVNNQVKDAEAIYEKIFVLRPNYVQSYRDLAESYRTSGNFKKSASMYARYQYLKDENLLRLTDTTKIHTILERESDNLLTLEGNNVLDGGEGIERSDKFVEFDGTRLVFEWNDSEAEFDLQFVNPQKHYLNWEHTMFANNERINEEKVIGYSCEEFLMDGSLPGIWKVNVNYKGNKRLEPTYLKATIYYNYGRPAQKKEIKVFRLGLKNVNQELFELYNTSKVSN
ncbi:carboxypeptidase-like regulatory domain-containing protein [Maribacter sp. 2308TA10-17]|uniref:carboxypeptidase-like regulatory domain-containing protein n=1 Tax=Maribacter sp. 2308TA10-17 TaxID=3386276 RepID=UPI0039BCE641